MAEDWRTPNFRQNVVTKLGDAYKNTSGLATAKNMESLMYKKARTKEEYLGLIAKLISNAHEMINKTKNQAQQNTEVQSSGNMMQDPINALQNLASQGTRNPQMMAMPNQNNQMTSGSIGANATNLLQTLTQQRPGGQIQNFQGIRTQMNVPMGNNMPQNNMGPNTMGNTIGNINTTMNIPISQMNQPVSINNCLTTINQMPSGPMQMNNNMQGQSINTNMINAGQQMPSNTMNQTQMNVGINHPQMGQMMGRMNPNTNINIIKSSMMPSNVTTNIPPGMQNQINVPNNMNNQTQLPQTAVNQPVNQVGMAPNTAQINPGNAVNPIMNIPNMGQKSQNIVVNNNTANMFQGNRNMNQSQFLRQSPIPSVSSPAGITQPHQSSQMISSPAVAPSSSPQMSNVMSNNQRNALRQSPNPMINTPGQVPTSSPINLQEEQMYREKYKQLTKYIEPLTRMVEKLHSDDIEKITKLNALLDILCNPHKRIPLDTLLKCEIALDKMDFNQHASSTPAYPLVEALNATLKTATCNHTLQRTFRPCLEALFGTDIKTLPSTNAKRQKLTVEDTTEIPHVLQGEIARLDQKFKVSLDSSSPNNNKTIKLICCLDDKRLPCVPPLSIAIPEEYPNCAPSCSLNEYEYSATPFLKSVQSALMNRVAKLSKIHSLSHLLDTWEMAVRQACSPNNNKPSLTDLSFLF